VERRPDGAFVLSVNKYVESLQEIEVEAIVRIRAEKDKLLQAGKKFLASQLKDPARGAIGQLLWCTSKVRYELLATVCELARYAAKPEAMTDEWVSAVNEVIHFLKQNQSEIVIGKVENWKTEAPKRPCGINSGDTMVDTGYPMFTVFLDAAGGTPHRIGALFTLIGHHEDTDIAKRLSTESALYKYSMSTIQWYSRVPKRVTSSSSGAEVLALMQGCGESLFMARAMRELGLIHPSSCPLILTDARNATSLNPPTEKNLRVDWSALLDIRLRKKIYLRHISGVDNVSDVLTKPLSACNANLPFEMAYGFIRTRLESTVTSMGMTLA
jgi:hypothetical protein